MLGEKVPFESNLATHWIQFRVRLEAETNEMHLLLDYERITQIEFKI